MSEPEVNSIQSTLNTTEGNTETTTDVYAKMMTFDLSLLQPEMPVYVRVIGFILCLLITSTGFLGNLTVVLSVVRYRFLHTPANVVVASMACVDMSHVIGVFWIDLIIYSIGYWPFTSHHLCIYQLFFIIYGGEVNIFHIFIITFYRYLSVVYPKLHRHIQGPIAWGVSFGILYIAPLILLLTTSYKSTVNKQASGAVVAFNTKQMVCNVFIPNEKASNSFNWIFIQIFFGIFIILMYTHIYYVYQKSRNQVMNSQLNTATNLKKIKGALQEMRIMLLIIVIYLITNLVPPLMYLDGQNALNYAWPIAMIPIIMFWIRVNVNWFIYGALNTNFRTAYKKMFKLDKITMLTRSGNSLPINKVAIAVI